MIIIKAIDESDLIVVIKRNGRISVMDMLIMMVAISIIHIR